jgi:hypothetical protein
MSRAVAAGGTGEASKGKSTPRSTAGSSSRGGVGGYFRASELPLTSLAFLLPLVILYEVGTRAFTFDPVHQTEQRIIAFNLMQRFFLLFGASGRYLPALAVVGVLLSWHIARGDGWKIKIGHVGGMGLESLVLAMPLITLGRVAEQYLSQIPLAGASHSAGATTSLLVLSLGAGVYEELVFRLIAFTLLSFLLVDVLKMGKGLSSLLIVLLSAGLFSAYHYLGGEPFRWWTFAFRAMAGVYFGIVFVCRGFGITAGSHAAYDLCIVGLRALG